MRGENRVADKTKKRRTRKRNRTPRGPPAEHRVPPCVICGKVIDRAVASALAS